jgi:hypothetical protein
VVGRVLGQQHPVAGRDLAVPDPQRPRSRSDEVVDAVSAFFGGQNHVSLRFTAVFVTGPSLAPSLTIYASFASVGNSSSKSPGH